MTNSKRPYHVLAEDYRTLRITDFDRRVYEVPEGKRLNGKNFDEFIRDAEASQKARGGTFFDGPMVAVVMDPTQVSVKDGEIGFKAVSSTYFRHAFLRSDQTADAHAMYVNALVLTARDESGNQKLAFGSSQISEADSLGKLGVVAGSLLESPAGFPEFGAQIYRELGEEMGINHDLDVDDQGIVPGWINGASRREGTYHPTASFVVVLNLDEKQMREKYEDWREAYRKARKKTEFGKDLTFLPNDPDYWKPFIEGQDRKGPKNANIQGKSLDVVDYWVHRYGCDIQKLRRSKEGGAKLWLPQPLISEL